MTMTTAEYLALPPQERWALIEEHLFGGTVDREWEPWIVTAPNGRERMVRNFDEPNGYMTIARRFDDWDMRRRPSQPDESEYIEFVIFKDDAVVGHADVPSEDDYLAVQIAALRTIGFITD